MVFVLWCGGVCGVVWYVWYVWCNVWCGVCGVVWCVWCGVYGVMCVSVCSMVVYGLDACVFIVCRGRLIV